MFKDDRGYYQRRLQAETELARQARSPVVARVHQQLADAYLNKLALVELYRADAS